MNKHLQQARAALDAVIRKSRVHWYKPIQVAEILYHHRVLHDVNLDEIESFRSPSKRWRDDITLPLLGRVCNSSSLFQDDLFNDNALPPHLLKALALENKRTKGAVEAYIYKRFTQKYAQLAYAFSLCMSSTKETFDVKKFIDSFWREPGLRRSIDKVFEIVVYALFSTLVRQLQLQVEVSIDSSRRELLSSFEDFAEMVMGLHLPSLQSQQEGKIFRVGVTNAADRGLDMYSNWGPAIQIKHLSLDAEVAEDIVTSIESDRIVIVCRAAEQDIIASLLTQIGWRSKIQSIVTEHHLTAWYEAALRGKHSSIMGNQLLATLQSTLAKEFPSVGGLPNILQERHYDLIQNADWEVDPPLVSP